MQMTCRRVGKTSCFLLLIEIDPAQDCCPYFNLELKEIEQIIIWLTLCQAQSYEVGCIVYFPEVTGWYSNLSKIIQLVNGIEAWFPLTPGHFHCAVVLYFILTFFQ